MEHASLPLWAFFVVGLECLACSAEPPPQPSADPASPSAGVDTGEEPTGGETTPSGGSSSAGGTTPDAGAGAPHSATNGAGPPPSVGGRSIYAVECHGDSKQCLGATVPCLGVASETPNVAAGWACSNRCSADADCSDAPSGAEAKASCVSFSSARHCLLVCQNEAQAWSCPDGMACYVPQKSPIGYCLWP